MSAKFKSSNSISRQVAICGLIITVGYIGLFCLMQAPAFWYSLRPDPVRSLIPEVFGPINALFPQQWVTLERTDRFALTAVPIYLAVVVLITAPYLYLLWRMRAPGQQLITHRKTLLRTIFGFTLGIMVVLLWQRGLLSTDIYNYEWYSRIWVEYGASPYTHTPGEYPPDAEGSIFWIGWPDVPAVYGPAWLIISALARVVGQLAGGSFSAQLFALRLLADVAFLVSALLVWNIAGMMASRRTQPEHAALKKRHSTLRNRTLQIRAAKPRLRAPVARDTMERENHRLKFQFTALLFFIWNPLMLVEFAGSGHNDIVMLAFVLLALWLHLKGWWRAAALALGVAILVKIAAVVFLPGYLWLLFWEASVGDRDQNLMQSMIRGAAEAVQALAIMVTAGIILYAPFWEGLQTLQAVTAGPANRFFLQTLAADVYWNIPKLLANSIEATDERNLFIATLRQILLHNLRWWMLVLFGIITLAVTWKARTFNRMLTAWGWVAIAATMTQGWFWPWYATWAIVPAIFAPSRRLRNATLVFAVSGVLMYLEALILSDHFKLFEEWPGTFVMAPTLIYILFSWPLEMWRNRKIDSIAQPTRSPSTPQYERGTT